MGSRKGSQHEGREESDQGLGQLVTLEKPSDFETIAAINNLNNNGETSEIAFLYLNHQRALHRTALSVTSDKEEAHDAVIDVLLKLFELRKEILPEINGLAWLKRMVRNRAVDLARRRQRCVPVDNMEGLLLCIDAGDSTCDRIVVSELLDQLDNTSRRIVLEKAIAGKTHKEIATMLGMPVSSVHRIYRRALSILRTSLHHP